MSTFLKFTEEGLTVEVLIPSPECFVQADSLLELESLFQDWLLDRKSADWTKKIAQKFPSLYRHFADIFEDEQISNHFASDIIKGFEARMKYLIELLTKHPLPSLDQK